MTNISEAELRTGLHKLADHAPTFVVPTPVVDRAPINRIGPSPWRWSLVAVTSVILIIAAAPIIVALSDEGRDSDPAGSSASDLISSSPTTPDVRDDLAGKDRVRAIADELNLYKEPGFGKVAVDFSTAEVRVYWKGEPPNVVAEAAGLREDGVTVVLIQVAYSARELELAGEELLAASRRAGPVRIVSVRPAKDLSGVTVGILPKDMPEDIEDLRRTFEEIAGGVPVTIEEDSGYFATVPGA
jgi:hypothetical protein